MSFFDKWKKKLNEVKETLKDIFLEPDVDFPPPKPKPPVKKLEKKTLKEVFEETKVKIKEELFESEPQTSQNQPVEGASLEDSLSRTSSKPNDQKFNGQIASKKIALNATETSKQVQEVKKSEYSVPNLGVTHIPKPKVASVVTSPVDKKSDVFSVPNLGITHVPKSKVVSAVTAPVEKPRHHAAKRPVVKPVADQIKRAIVGVDFGTSFTKAWCNIAQWKEFAISFDVDGDRTFFLPTVLYYNARINKLATSSRSGYTKIEYFKYGMINDSLCTTGEMLSKNKSSQNRMDFICSVFFMANVIKLIKVAVQKECPGSKIEIDFNMGCPLDNFLDSSKRIYDNVLNLAYKLSSIENFDSLYVSELDAFISENFEYKNASLQTVAELYAEALWFIEQPSVGEGIYSVLDIGGGTADFATLSVKWVDGEKKTKIFSQKAVPLGVEILLKELYSSEYLNNREACIADFKKKNVVIPSFGNKKELVNPHHVLGQQFQEGFFKGIKAVKDIDYILMKAQWDDGYGTLPYYTFGGGADIGWYHSIIKNNKEMLKANVPPLIRKNVAEKEPRLIIARQLSRSYFPDIDGFPWTFKKNDSKIDGSDLYRNVDYGILDT